MSSATTSPALEQLQEQRAAFTRRIEELRTDARNNAHTLETARADLGEAIAAGADASAIHARIRELEAREDGLQRAIVSVGDRRDALKPAIDEEVYRLAAAEAQRTESAFREAVRALEEHVTAAALRASELMASAKRLGTIANSAAVRRDQANGVAVSSFSAQQVYSGTLPVVGIGNVVQELESFVRRGKDEANMAAQRAPRAGGGSRVVPARDIPQEAGAIA